MKKTLSNLRWLLISVSMAVSFLATASLGQETKSVPTKTDTPSVTELWRQVEVIRTAHGVPHIRAENLKAAAYALAWLQLEDYGPGTAINVLEASGRWAWVAGYERVESDFVISRMREVAVKNYP